MSFPRYQQYKDSGVHWLGDVPAHWSVTPLKYLAQFRSGGTPSKDRRDYWDGCIPWASAKDMKAETLSDTADHLTERAIAEGAAEPVGPGVVLVVVRGMILARTFPVALTTVPMAINQDLKALIAGRRLCPGFLAWLLRGTSEQSLHRIDEAGHGTKALRMDAWSSLALCVPPVNEQAEIAAFLDRETAKIDALVAEQQNLIALLKEKRQALISHAVTTGLDPAVPMKDSGVAWLGEVPAHWEVGPLKRFADVIDCKHYTVQFLDEGWPIASIRELRDDRLDLSDAKLTSRAEWDFLREGRVPRRGDLIFCRNASVGAVGYVEEDVDFCMGQDVCLIRPSFDGRFMHYQLTCAVVRNQIEAFLVGATIRRANVEEIRNLVVVWPNESEQLLIAEYLRREASKFDALIAEAENAIGLLKERRTSMISAAVTGKIDVRGLVSAGAALEAEAV